jgi:alcohol dehydrogenase class IV
MFSTWDSKNPILFGCGTSKLTGEKARQFGCKKMLCVFDEGVRAAGIVDKILESLKAAGIGTVCYDGVLPDPPDYLVEEAAALGLAEDVDGIVAVGGGSSMDTGKGVRVLLSYPFPIGRYYCTYDTPALDETKMKPLIVLPTTAGTGSETSPGAVITDSATKVKNIINCTVSLGIVDPELTVGLPPTITANTGIDALSHAIEALTSIQPNRFSDILGKETVSLINKYLPVAYNDGANLEAREAMSLAATLATICVRGPFIHIPHAFGENLTSIWNIPHGITVAAFLPETMIFLAPVIPGKIRLIADCMGARVPVDSSPERIGAIAAGRIRQLLNAVHIPPLRSLVRNKEEFMGNTTKIYGSPEMLLYSPRPISLEEAKQFIENVYDGDQAPGGGWPKRRRSRSFSR